MAKTPSTMAELGTKAPPFNLKDPSGKAYSIGDFRDAPVLVVAFICNHCPYVQHIRKELAAFGKEYRAKGVAIAGINSNDARNYPDDSPVKMAEEAKRWGYTFPYLVDDTQEVAKAYRAACTPDFFVYGKDRKLAYRGQFDDSRPESGKPVTGKDLRAAVDALLAGKNPSKDQKASLGCNIKWKAGNEPDYF
ncbi:MAG: thioredoxin family protein [Bdellovibrionota bacterium]